MTVGAVLPLFRSYMKLEGYVEHIVYRNEENGYSVLNLVSEGKEITKPTASAIAAWIFPGSLPGRKPMWSAI